MSHNDSDRVFPLDAPVTGRETFHAARLATALKPAPASIVMGNRAFIRRWAARSAAKSAGLALAGTSQHECQNRPAGERQPFNE